jgi:hypothetical protein
MELLVSLGIFAVGALAIVGILLGLKYGIDYLKVKIGEAKFNQIVSYANLAVRAAEQLGIRFKYSNEEKKALVLGTVRKYMAQLNFDYDEPFLDDLIEGAVQRMNSEFDKLFPLLEE